MTKEEQNQEPEQQPQISKRAIKKQKKELEMQQNKEQWKQRKKVSQLNHQQDKKRKTKEKKEQDRKDGIERPDKGFDFVHHRKDFRNKVKESKYPIMIDGTFHEQLTHKELKSLSMQIGYCHNFNKKFQTCSKLSVCGLHGKFKEMMQKHGVDSWGADLLENNYLEKYSKEDIIYLSADAEEEIEEIEQQKVYVIGGLCDHNRLKMATFNKAKQEGVQCKKIPIQKYLELKSSTVLAVNHVFEMLVRKINGQSWQDAIVQSVPKRKVK